MSTMHDLHLGIFDFKQRYDNFDEKLPLSLGDLLDKGNTKAQKLDEIRYFSVDQFNLSDLEPLARMTELHELQLYLPENLELPPLNRLTKLSKVTLSVSSGNDISPLLQLKSLKEFVFRAKEDFDFSILSSFNTLESLDLNSTPIRDIQPLANLSNLLRLTLNPGRSDVEENGKLFFVTNESNIVDFTPLAHLSKLIELDLSCTKISDFSVLSGLKALEN